MNKSLLIFVTLIFLCYAGQTQSLIKAKQLFNLSETDPIDKIILAESANLDSLVVSTRVWLSDQLSTQFDPLFGVIINKKHILELARKNNIADVRNLFRLILSHEKMHALQSIRLNNIGSSYQLLTSEEKQILECQADICAGYLFLFPFIKQYSELLTKYFLYAYRNSKLPGGNTFPIPDFSSADSMLTFTALKRNYDGLQLFFDLGEREGVFGTHPNPFNRKTAFEMGLNAFQLTAIQVPLPPSLINKISPQEWEYLNAIYKSIIATLGILPQHSQPQGFFELWSQHIAKKIIHLSNKASTKILFTIEKSKWDTSINNNLHYYKIRARNDNPDSMIIDMDVLSKLVDRKKSDDPIKSKIAVANHYFFTLPPNGEHTINDSIMWIPGTDTTMPRVVYPGDEGSLYIVYPANPKAAISYKPITPVTQANPALNDFSAAKEKLLRLLPLIQRDFNMNDVRRFKDGAGITWNKALQIQYNAFIGGEHFLLYIPVSTEEKPYLSKAINSFDTFSEALAAYDSFKKELLELLGESYILDEEQSQLKNYRYAEILNADKKSIYSLSISKEYLVYKLHLEVFKQ